MFTLGIVMLVIGCILRIHTRISSRNFVRAMAPRNIILHNSTMQDLKQTTHRRLTDANILLLIGTILILVTAVFN